MEKRRSARQENPVKGRDGPDIRHYCYIRYPERYENSAWPDLLGRIASVLAIYFTNFRPAHLSVKK